VHHIQLAPVRRAQQACNARENIAVAALLLRAPTRVLPRTWWRRCCSCRTAHKSLQKLDLSYNKNYTMWPFHYEEDDSAAFAALGELVAADGPLQELNMYVPWSHLGDTGLRQLVDALRRNTHLRSLNIGFSGISAAFVNDQLLPAVGANSSLCELDMTGPGLDGLWKLHHNLQKILQANRRLRLPPGQSGLR
jgi:hypothetical protein